MTDQLRPLHPYAAKLYDAFARESKHREGKEFEVWNDMEIKAVWREAKKIAKALNKPEPTLQMIKQEESSASGHSDYGHKWAINVWYRIK
jgi:hypothetical protein